MGKSHKQSGGGSGDKKKAKKKGKGNFFERMMDVGNDVMNDVVDSAKKAGNVIENGATSFLDEVSGKDDEMTDKEILDMTSAIPNQDIIYEQLALAAYGKWSPESLAQWGYELLNEFEDPSTGLRMMTFAPVDFDFSKWPALEEVLKEQHGGLDRHPVVSFRGTANMEGVMDDMNEQGVGAYQFSASEGDIKGLLSEASGFGKIDVTGHSLGGALAQICAARYPGLMGRIATFQSPAINADDAAKLEEHNKNAAPEDQIHSTHYRNNEDLVHLAGQELTKGVVYEFDVDGDSKKDAHTKGLLSQLNAKRGGPVARTYGGGAYQDKDKDKDGRKELKGDAYQEKDKLEGVEVMSTDQGKDGFMHGLGEGMRKGVGTLVDNTVGRFDKETDSRDNYVEAWETAKQMHTDGASLREVNDHIADAKDLTDPQRLRMANQMSKLFA